MDHRNSGGNGFRYPECTNADVVQAEVGGTLNPWHRTVLLGLGSDGSTNVGAVVRRRPNANISAARALDQDGQPDGPGHTIHLPGPTSVGDGHVNARFTEGAACLRMLLEAEAVGVGNGLLDAQPEWDDLTGAVSRAPRRLLMGADVATTDHRGARRARQVWHWRSSP